MLSRLQAGSIRHRWLLNDGEPMRKEYKEADWRKNQPPRWWLNCIKQFKLKTERAREINVDQGKGSLPSATIR
jgi:hypothetical protein